MSTEQNLKEARAALHLLITGKSTVSVQRDGKIVWFQQANRRDLEAYINQLEGQLGGGGHTRRRPASVIA
ncbi:MULTISPECIES: gpW family head-tail joining protein [unclassified Pseudomonas]|uniref:gpW family head-tail joining protein n=1 Tax=unclassified Pseudomonas TaxID=196821 RepID=UPI00244B4A3C|nr:MULTISPECIES: gpW family head-tail joining protein [unclassified Pseudomonas]MDG9928524.1 gpW family protein [Pseudomonas sp. GD04042]MDH0482694.1 gpW family protein [Pseudomonas sp. GD04015]MDH0604604.1 gpW family protein [Pseudomonas sp. GD03869]